MNALTGTAGDHRAPACGSAERPPRTRTGRALLSMRTATPGEHACRDRARHVFVNGEEAREAVAPD